MKPILFLAGVAILVLSGCGSLRPRDFAGEPRVFDPMRYFEGRVVTCGVVESPSGEPRRRFASVDIGRRDGEVLLLDQQFAYDDGEKQSRHWRIRRVSGHRYEAQANDSVGMARGEVWGNAFNFEYTLALKPGNPLYNVRMRQWMYLQPGGQAMVNHVTVTKLGLRLAGVTEYFQKESAQRTETPK